MEGLMFDYWYKKVAREALELMYVPSIFACIGNKRKMNEYHKGQQKAEKAYEKIKNDRNALKEMTMAYAYAMKE